MAFRSVDPDTFEWDNISVELDDEERVPTGRIIDPGFAGLGDRRVSMPALLAHRPDASRFFRLARIVGAARALSFAELGDEGPALLDAALLSIMDAKGDFEAVWRATAYHAALEAILAKAVALEGEDPKDQLGHIYEKPHRPQ